MNLHQTASSFVFVVLAAGTMPADGSVTVRQISVVVEKAAGLQGEDRVSARLSGSGRLPPEMLRKLASAQFFRPSEARDEKGAKAPTVCMPRLEGWRLPSSSRTLIPDNPS
jgi:hypothetical protein